MQAIRSIIIKEDVLGFFSKRAFLLIFFSSVMLVLSFCLREIYLLCEKQWREIRVISQAFNALHISMSFILYPFISRRFHPPSPLHIVFSNAGHHGEGSGGSNDGIRSKLVVWSTLFVLFPSFNQISDVLRLSCSASSEHDPSLFRMSFLFSSQIVIPTIIWCSGYRGPWSQARLQI